MNRALRVALFCGALPLVVGVSTFVLWLITGWESLVTVGACTLLGGCVLFCFGVIAFAAFLRSAGRTQEVSPQPFRLAMYGTAALLGSNFVVAALIIAAVYAIETSYTVAVKNDSARTLEHVRVFVDSCEVSFGSLPRGGVVRRSFWIRCEGSLDFHAVSGATVYSATIDGYVTGGMSGDKTVTINRDGSISVSDARD